MTDPQKLIAMYNVIASKRIAIDTLMWQVPALSLTAQAFLFTISLSPNSTWIERSIACFISIMISLLSCQLLMKHSASEKIHSMILEEMENKLDFKLFLSETKIILPHKKLNSVASDMGRKFNWIENFSSRKLWRDGLIGFTLINLSILFIQLSFPQLL